MARYRLLAKHYLNVPGTEWERVEVDQQSGKQLRKRYNVPRHLDPQEPSDINYPRDGLLIVTDKEDPQHPMDIIFVGEPTLDMEPLDEEARQAIALVAKRGQHPIEALPGQGEIFSEKLLQHFEAALTAAMRTVVPTSKPDDRVAVLEAQVAELTRMLKAAPPPPSSEADGTAEPSAEEAVATEPLPPSSAPKVKGFTIGARP